MMSTRVSSYRQKIETLMSKIDVILEELDIRMDKFLKIKIAIMIYMIINDDNQDNYLIIEGDKGVGKTSLSVLISYIVARITDRNFSHENLFFKSQDAVNFAKRTEKQVVVFDEPAFGGLKRDWRNKVQSHLIQLLFTARKKRHFVIFNLIKFDRFSSDIIEAAFAMIKVFKLSEVSKERKFMYFDKKRLRGLLEFYQKKRYKDYRKFKIAVGNVPPIKISKMINEVEYEKMKDDAIASIGDDDKKIEIKNNGREKELKAKLWEIVDLVHRTTGMKKKDLLEAVKLNERMVQMWNPRENKGQVPVLLEKDMENDRNSRLNIYNRGQYDYFCSEPLIVHDKDIQPIVCKEEPAPYTNSAVPSACEETCQEDIRMQLPG